MKKVIDLYKLSPYTEGLNRADLDWLVLSILPLSFVIVVDVVIDIILFCDFVFLICLFFTERHVIFSKILLEYIWMETPPFSKKQLIKNVCNLR